jgi:hypothetical protein
VELVELDALFRRQVQFIRYNISVRALPSSPRRSFHLLGQTQHLASLVSDFRNKADACFSRQSSSSDRPPWSSRLEDLFDLRRLVGNQAELVFIFRPATT